MTTASGEPRRATGKLLSLPLDLWPEADRNAWNVTCRPAARLRPGGAVGHLKPVTRDDLARRYGSFSFPTGAACSVQRNRLQPT